MTYAWQHFKTITAHKWIVMRYCFRMGLIWQGLLHDLSKYSPVEFLAGAKYWQGDRSPNNAEREATGISYSWLHHKGRNRHHFEYWIDYGLDCDTILTGMQIPRVFVAEMIADRIGASRVYKKDSYTDAEPYIYLQLSIDKLWFVHPDVRDQLTYLLGMLAVRGEKETMAYIRHVYLKYKKEPWTKPADHDIIKQSADRIAAEAAAAE